MDSASRESFAKIESLESDLLQHVHTSGVREGKLRQLVDEIMAVRTDRRRLFTALTSENTSLVEKISLLNGELKQLKDSFNRQVETEVESRTIKLQEKYNELLGKSRSYREYIVQMKEERNDVIKKEKEILASIFAEKIALLDSKLKELQHVETVHTEQAEKMKKDNDELISHYNVKIDKYKVAIRELVEREKEYEVTHTKNSSKIKILLVENDSLKKEFNILQERIAARYLEEKELRLTSATAQREVELMRENYEAREANHAREIQDLVAKHEEELGQVDGKVRKLLAARDETIAALKHQLVHAEKKKNDAEKILTLLNDGLREK